MKAETVEHLDAADATLEQAAALAVKLGADYLIETENSSRSEEYFVNIKIKAGSFLGMQLLCLLYDPETALFSAFSITGITPVAFFTSSLSDLVDTS